MRALTALSALVAAVAGGGAGVLLVGAYRRARRPNAACWAVSCLLFSVASGALGIATVTGWSSGLFRVYYLAGGALTVPWMAVGAAWLFGPKRAAALATAGLIGFSIAALTVTLSAEIDVPRTTDPIRYGAVLAGANAVRALAVVANSAGTVGAVLLFTRIAWSFHRKGVLEVRARGSARIAAGVGMAAAGGVLAAVELHLLHAPALATAGVLLFAGFRRWTSDPAGLAAVAGAPLTDRIGADP